MYENQFVILGGDFNCTLDPDVDRHRSVERHSEIVRILKNFVYTSKLRDSWRHFHRTKGYTFISPTIPHSASRIDRIYCSDGLLTHIKSVNVSATFSDHLAVSSVFQIQSSKTCFPPYWKFNNSLLEDPQFTECVSQFLDNEIASMPPDCDILKWWDALKINLKQIIVLYSRQKKNTMYLELSTMQREIKRRLDRTNYTSQDFSDIIRLLRNVKDWYHGESESVLLRSRYEALTESDRPCVNKKAFTTFKPLSRLTIGDTVIKESIPLCAYVKSQFTEKHSETEHRFDRGSVLFKDLKKLSSNDRVSLDRPFTVDEITRALMSLKRSSAPGIDGMTTEFYIRFWNTLKHVYLKVVCNSLDQQRLPNSATKAVVSLLPKKGDLEILNNWRPISVLTTDYKIIAKTLSMRLSDVIGTVVDSDQTYSIPGRTIYDNLHLCRDVIQYANHEDLPVAMLNLDQKSAFDKIDHNYLFQLLEIFGFGNGFINALKTLYNDAVFHVRIGHLLTGLIHFKKGIRQGCPLSGPLYSLTIEPFLNLCRRYLTGITLPSKAEIKLTVSAYADDVTVFMSKESDFKVFRMIYDTYSTQSGAELNLDKSRGFWTGRWKLRQDRPLNYEWSSDSIKTLGIKFSNDLEADTQYAVEVILEQLQQSFTKWKQRLPSVSLVGRKIIINQFVTPKLWHYFHILPFTEAQLKTIQKVLLDFFWTGKHWTSAKDVCVPIDQGGVGLVHLKSKLMSFRLLTANRFISQHQNHKWKILMEFFIVSSNPYRASWQSFYNYNFSSYPCAFPFVSSVSEAFQLSNVHVKFPRSFDDLKSIPTTNTSLLLKTVPPIFNDLWLHYGFRTVIDFMESNVWISNEAILQKINNASNVVCRDLMSQYNRIKAYFKVNYENLPRRCPNSSDIQLLFRSNDKEYTVCKGARRQLYRYLTCRIFKVQGSMAGAWSDDEVIWSSYFNKITLGFDSEIPWRFAKNRLADPVFLFKCGYITSSCCPFCPDTPGSAWHMILSCSRVRTIWNIVRQLVAAILDLQQISTRDLYCGFSGHSAAHDLANYITNVAKTTIYRVLTDYFRDGKPLIPYQTVFAKKVKSRLITEFSWCLGKKNTEKFILQWCIGNAICQVGSSSELKFTQLIDDYT